MIHSNFTAELHCQYGQVGVTNYQARLDFLGMSAADEDGWLCTSGGGAHDSVCDLISFNFEYIEQVGERVYYNITGASDWAYQGARLSQNANGWLGLYGIYAVDRLVDALNPATLIGELLNHDLWKIETLQEWDGSDEGAECVDFYLRDDRGYRVSMTKASNEGLYLNASKLDGEVLTFNLRNIKRI